jgi:predicted PurR-regulated permease PerM
MDTATIPEPIRDRAAAMEPSVDALISESSLVEPPAKSITRTTHVQIVLIVLGTIAFFYFARPVLLPIFLACVAAMTLKPLIRWSSYCHIPPALSAAVVISLLVAGVVMVSFNSEVQR